MAKERLTQRDEFGNAEIIALSDFMPELYAELSFSETNALTNALNKLADYEDKEENREATPTADVQKVRHGEWCHIDGDEWCCSYCGHIVSTEGSWEKPAKKYCSECGAKMDKECEQ